MFGIVKLERTATQSLENDEWELLTKLCYGFDVLEYGVGFPSASVYGMNGSRELTRKNIEEALKVACKNFGLDPERFSFKFAPCELEYIPGTSLCVYRDWTVTISPKEK